MESLKQNKSFYYFLKVLNVVSYILCMVINGIGSAGFIGEGSNSDISKKYETNITPDGWAFSIWSLIFTLQGAYTVYQALPFQDDRKKEYVLAINIFLATVWNLESAWTFAFNYDVIWLSLVLMYLTWISIAVTYYSINKIQINFWSSVFGFEKGDTGSDRFFKIFIFLIAYLSTAVNFGWLTVASLANTSILIDQQNYDFSNTWGVSFIIIATLAGFLMLIFRREAPFALVITWALFAIASKQKGNNSIVTSAIIGASVNLAGSLIAIGINIWKDSKQKKSDGNQKLLPA